MPRLLLVDDNPSIHRIAESLLAHTDVELACVDSAAEALDRLQRGEHFDVALVDTAMPGMDGWTLLGRLRSMEETATMPIALMAGVLDPVDPAKLAKAPIQGFLKKPIELRELGDRVKALLETPVAAAPSPFSTVPATPASELLQRAEQALPEFRYEPEPAAVEPADLGEAELDLLLPTPEDDLLVLTAEDLWPEEALPSAPVAEAAPAVQLDLEELDLDSLQDLTAGPMSVPVPAPEPAAVAPLVEPLPAEDEPLALPAFELPAVPLEEEGLVTMSGLEELDALAGDFPLPPAAAAAAVPAGAVTQASLPEPAPEPVLEPHPEPVLEPVLEAVPDAAPLAAAPAADRQAAAASGQPAVAPEQAQALVQALLADPILVDALVKAVVARMGDQVLREIAWEVMPDLAGRLQQ